MKMLTFMLGMLTTIIYVYSSSDWHGGRWVKLKYFCLFLKVQIQGKKQLFTVLPWLSLLFGTLDLIWTWLCWHWCLKYLIFHLRLDLKVWRLFLRLNFKRLEITLQIRPQRLNQMTWDFEWDLTSQHLRFHMRLDLKRIEISLTLACIQFLYNLLPFSRDGLHVSFYNIHLKIRFIDCFAKVVSWPIICK